MKKTLGFLLFIVFFCTLFSDTIFFDDFENDTGWTLSGEFEIATPNGLGGDHGNSDPFQAYEGTKVLGVDLTGYGDYPGDYEPNLSEDQYFAISPTIDCSNYLNCSISFKRWLGIEQPAYDHARVEISNDNGISWITIWENTETISDNAWQDITFDISEYADFNSLVKIAFTIGTTDGSWQYCGWNIDNFIVNGDPALYGNIQGHIFDSETMQPINNAMISTLYSHTFSDTNGYYILYHIPCIPVNISISAAGYQNFTSEMLTPEPDSTITRDFLLQQEQNLPPPPRNLVANVESNIVHLSWLPPESSDNFFISYNIFRNNILIDSITDTLYDDPNLIIGEYTYYITALYDVGNSFASNTVTVQINTNSTNNDEISEQTVIAGNYPNPFSTTAHIFYQLKKSARIKIDIYNLKGQKITTLVNDNKKQGRYLTQWNSKDKKGKIYPSGIYYYLISANGKKVKTGKLLLLK